VRFSWATSGFLTHPLFERGIRDRSAVVEGRLGVWYGTGRHFEKTLDGIEGVRGFSCFEGIGDVGVEGAVYSWFGIVAKSTLIKFLRVIAHLCHFCRG